MQICVRARQRTIGLFRTIVRHATKLRTLVAYTVFSAFLAPPAWADEASQPDKESRFYLGIRTPLVQASVGRQPPLIGGVWQIRSVGSSFGSELVGGIDPLELRFGRVLRDRIQVGGWISGGTQRSGVTSDDPDIVVRKLRLAAEGRFVFRHDHALRPYAGLSLALVLSQYKEPGLEDGDARKGVRSLGPQVYLLGGAQWTFTPHVALDFALLLQSSWLASWDHRGRSSGKAVQRQQGFGGAGITAGLTVFF